jgi:hypothetical protein
MTYYQSYRWSSGTPQGIHKIVCPHGEHISYKLRADPYRKPLCIEEYKGLSYKILGDDFNGVAVFDANAYPVLMRLYAVDKVTSAYTHIEEVIDAPCIKKI